MTRSGRQRVVRSPDEVRSLVDSLVAEAAVCVTHEAGTPDWVRGFARRAGQLGLLDLLVEDGRLAPHNVGPAQLATERLAAHSASMAMIVGAGRIQSVMLAAIGTTSLAQRWLQELLKGKALGSIAVSEPHAGSDVRNMSAMFHPGDGGGGTLTADKTWVALSPAADFVLVLAKVGDAARDADMAVVLAERDGQGVEFSDLPVLMSYEALPMGNVRCEKARVDPDQVLRGRGGLAAFLDVLNYARIEAASHGVGLLQACLDATVQHVRSRVAFERPLADLQGVQQQIGRMLTDLEAARSLRDRAASSYATGAADWRLCAAAKVFASDSAAHHSAQAMQLFGAAGLLRGGKIETVFRDAKAVQTFDGTSPVLMTSVGRDVLKARP